MYNEVEAHRQHVTVTAIPTCSSPAYLTLTKHCTLHATYWRMHPKLLLPKERPLQPISHLHPDILSLKLLCATIRTVVNTIVDWRPMSRHAVVVFLRETSNNGHLPDSLGAYIQPTESSQASRNIFQVPPQMLHITTSYWPFQKTLRLLSSRASNLTKTRRSCQLTRIWDYRSK